MEAKVFFILGAGNRCFAKADKGGDVDSAPQFRAPRPCSSERKGAVEEQMDMILAAGTEGREKGERKIVLIIFWVNITLLLSQTFTQ